MHLRLSLRDCLTPHYIHDSVLFSPEPIKTNFSGSSTYLIKMKGIQKSDYHQIPLIRYKKPSVPKTLQQVTIPSYRNRLTIKIFFIPVKTYITNNHFKIPSQQKSSIRYSSHHAHLAQLFDFL